MTEQGHDPAAILARYIDGVAQLEAAIVGLTESDLDIAQAAGRWTIRQIVHHVIDGDDLRKVCIKAALGNSEDIFSFEILKDDMGPGYYRLGLERFAL